MHNMHLLQAVKLSLIVTLLSACQLSPYSISVNNNILFNPQRKVEIGTLSDPALQACVNNFLNDNPEETLETLSLLSCTDAGISSLQGINQMAGLSLLDLSNNEVSDLGQLRGLENLRVLRLSNNAIRNIGPLNDLARLNFIDLSDNNGITCRALERLEDRLGPSLIRPLSCL